MHVIQKVRKEVSIQNVILTADLKQKIDLLSFNNHKFLSANLELYRCGYVKDDTMTGRVTVFASGKLISVGTKSIQQAKIELNKACKILEDYKLIKNYNLKPIVQNIVGRFELDHELDIAKLCRIIPKSMYEPEQFPGIIFRIQNSLVALIFASGKGIIVGAKSIEELNQGIFEIKKWSDYDTS